MVSLLTPFRTTLEKRGDQLVALLAGKVARMLAHGMVWPGASAEPRQRDTEGPFTVAIEGVTEPATFTRLDDAVEATWQSLRRLPLGSHQYEAYREFFGDGAVERVQRFLERDRELTLSFTMAGEPHAVRITPAMPK